MYYRSKYYIPATKETGYMEFEIGFDSYCDYILPFLRTSLSWRERARHLWALCDYMYKKTNLKCNLYAKENQSYWMNLERYDADQCQWREIISKKELEEAIKEEQEKREQARKWLNYILHT